MADTPAAVSPPQGVLGYFPVGLFGGVMGLTGLSAAWRLACMRYGMSLWIANITGLVAVGAFVAVFVAYLIKCISSPAAVKTEFRHPIAGNVFGTVFVSMLLLPIVVASASLLIARVLWLIGTVGIVIFAWVIASRWLRVPQNRSDVSPSWIIPVVGLLDIPLAVPLLGWVPLSGIMIYGLAVGLFFTTPLFTLIFSDNCLNPPCQIPSSPRCSS